MWKETLRGLDYGRVPAIVSELWRGRADSVALVNEGINLVFRFEEPAGGAFLRITHTSLSSRVKVESAVDYLRHAFSRGARVNEPLPSVNGRLVEEAPEGSGYLATVVREARGQRLSADTLEPNAFREWGYALGTLHLAAESYSAPERSWFLDWESIMSEIGGMTPNDDALLRRELDAVDRWIRSLPADRDVGLTHGDFRPGNAIWDGRRVTLIDFDEPVWQWWAVDVARAMLEFEARPLGQRRELLATFLEGYRRVRPLDAFWESQIGWLLRYRVLCMVVWSLGDEPSGGSGAWIGDLRRRIEQPTPW